ncbi:3-hydroxyacyl-CoA dehydrogenase family protein [Bradyrhizobium elkanii]|uniref:3-hydroxyacyl-CoA dehydrogenase family protein n=1 Tax=Bradyrhizobium elkanii TaxID=29448 RepID=UPI0009B5E57F|nr:3-hydroxyacyl-CoA dehydrogenase family protein [Bradyrhizobium elkanii]
MRYSFQTGHHSNSFPEGDAFLRGQQELETAEIVICDGKTFRLDPSRAVILVELQHECLGEHVDTQNPASHNVLGFARYCNGGDAPSKLVELVRHDNSATSVIEAARELFVAAGLEVAVCDDQVGRIVNRLVVPKLNAALRFLDEGLAKQADMDLTCKLGLGYPDGPIERVVRGGLADHYRLSRSLFEAFGTPAFVPARQAAVAFRREASGSRRSCD